MLITLVATIILICICAAVHYEMLVHCNAALLRLNLRHHRVKVLFAVGAGMASHLVQIGLFAGAFFLMQSVPWLGRLGGQFNGLPLSYMYFSAETYTSLGFGDVFPLGDLRMLAGAEALTGLLMISWTASFTYLQMSRYWSSAPDIRK
jgi:hypothetical protein